MEFYIKNIFSRYNNDVNILQSLEVLVMLYYCHSFNETISLCTLHSLCLTVQDVNLTVV